MNKQFYRDAFGWGLALWFIGYIIGILLFFVLPPHLIGWAITPIGVAITLWVLLKKVKPDSFRNYIPLAFIWLLVAVVFDYLLLVKVFKPADGYYKIDVYLYYLLTLLLPLVVGFIKKKR